jgi:1,4-dihydroxy-2-naphthoyl-CoA hydrolase
MDGEIVGSGRREWRGCGTRRDDLSYALRSAAMSEDFTAVVNGMIDGYNAAMGVRFVRVTLDEVSAELDVGPQHLQPFGLVHGGVYAGLVETVCSVGAGVHAVKQGRSTVGLENHTSFLQAVRGGTLRATAHPLVRGRLTHVWQATITDDRGRAVATGQVRLLMLDPNAAIAGEVVEVKVST